MCRTESRLKLMTLLVAAALGGCDSDLVVPLEAAPPDAAIGGNDTRDAGPDSDRTGSLCDGSTDIRLGYQVAGGGPAKNDSAFMKPYGHLFLVIDGSCNFYLNTVDAREGTRSGELSADEAEQLSRDVSFAKLPQWNGHYGQGCPDAPGELLTTSASRLSLSCSCGCEGAPQGAEAAMTKAAEWRVKLEARATVLNGPIRALAKLEERVHASTPSYAWPFERAIAETPGLVFEPSYIDPPPPGVLFEGGDATALRALRTQANTDRKEVLENDLNVPSPVFIDHDSRGYLLYLRDELPADHAAGIGKFFSLPGDRTDADAGL